MKVTWSPADPPLPATAAAGNGQVATRLAERVRGNPYWSVTRLDGWTVVHGDRLPWVDGVVYLGELSGAEDILVPVHRHPDLHPDLVRQLARELIQSPQPARIAVIPVDAGVAVLPLRPR